MFNYPDLCRSASFRILLKMLALVTLAAVIAMLLQGCESSPRQVTSTLPVCPDQSDKVLQADLTRAWSPHRAYLLPNGMVCQREYVQNVAQQP